VSGSAHIQGLLLLRRGRSSSDLRRLRRGTDTPRLHLLSGIPRRDRGVAGFVLVISVHGFMNPTASCSRRPRRRFAHPWSALFGNSYWHGSGTMYFAATSSAGFLPRGPAYAGDSCAEARTLRGTALQRCVLKPLRSQRHCRSFVGDWASPRRRAKQPVKLAASKAWGRRRAERPASPRLVQRPRGGVMGRDPNSFSILSFTAGTPGDRSELGARRRDGRRGTSSAQLQEMVGIGTSARALGLVSTSTCASAAKGLPLVAVVLSRGRSRGTAFRRR